MSTTALVAPSIMFQILPVAADSLYPCPQPNQASSCSVPAGTSAVGAIIKYYGVDASSGENAPNGFSYRLDNDANISSENQNTNEVLSVVVVAGGGHDEDGFHSATDGGNGGTITINNSGRLDGNVFTSGQVGFGDNQRGLWDRDGSMFVVRAVSVGGQGGGDIDTGVGGGSGGDGGDGGTTTVTNTGNLTVNMSNDSGQAGIYAGSIGGDGGAQDSQAVGDQVGGRGGDGGMVNVTNSGEIDFQFTGDITGFSYGIGAESLGGDGGKYNGTGGHGGAVAVTTEGTIDQSSRLSSQDSSGADVPAITDGVRAVSAVSRGGNGHLSEDGSDDGAPGGSGGAVITNVGGASKTDISTRFRDAVDDGDLRAISGAVVSISQGGDGGDGPATVTNTSGEMAGEGGAGGQVTTTLTNAQVSLHDDYVIGVGAFSAGGTGGDGRETSSAADGGAGGAVSLTLTAQSTISTDGVEAHALFAQSQGGTGGYLHPKNGLVNFNDEAAGRGGAAGNVVINYGLDDIGSNSVGRITTYDDHAHGILAQSLGGGGGSGYQSFLLLDNNEGDAGGGGAAGTVSVTGTSELQMHGDYAIGILAQSIGGGGGNAGQVPSLVDVPDDSGSSQSVPGLIAIGGSGGGAAAGNAVDVTQYSDVTTRGMASIGVLAQSIGGGGGNGGGLTGVNSVGGQGGLGGDGGLVTMNLPSGTVQTDGDFAYGIALQSIGGGGGNGGNAFDLSTSTPAVGLGGDGDVAGNGAAVTFLGAMSTGLAAANSAEIETSGDNAHAVLLQSVGGGGGSGGNAMGASFGSIASYQVAGAASAGGRGGAVTSSANGLDISTDGSHSSGVIGQSIGGGGGTGGSAFSFDANVGFAFSASIGGFGGDGGAGGSVDMGFAASTITTDDDHGTDSHGVVAQSIGGGGGIGGSSVADALAVAVPTGEDVSVGAAASAAIGGAGGNGGNGAAVSLEFDSTEISTKADGSFGIIAHSVGGGGGLGGSASSMAGVIGGSDAVSASVSMSVGASGGGGGSGDDVDVGLENQTSIRTRGDFANAVVAQSIGGGGGNAGVGSAGISHVTSAFNLSATIGLGGTGGSGNQGGNVSVQVDDASMITTNGAGARGIVAQTIGGGGTSQGGSVGLSISGESTDSEGEGTDGEGETSSASATVTIGLGNKGGAGSNGNGSKITSVDMQGVIQTAGTDADAILVQSVGGGGGLGGSMGGESSGSSDDADTSYEFGLSLGGSGGVGGNGGTAEVAFGGQISTAGDWADGIVVQSIGGGGGAGGTATIGSSDATTSLTAALGGKGGAGGEGGAITVTLEEDGDSSAIFTQGYGAIGVLAQSIGGGGGQGGDGSNSADGTISLGIDGATAYDSRGGIVAVTGETNIHTLGTDAHGVVAQSIGGGGGVYGAGNASSTQDDDSHSLNLSLGALLGGSSAKGSEVTVDMSGAIVTEGDLSFGVLAQSIGGGGGVVTAGGSHSMASLQFGAESSSARSESDGGQVNVSFSSGQISTTGMGAHGIVAQSIGGGGGIAGDFTTGAISLSDSTSFGAGGNDTGAGAAVTIDVGGDIHVAGRQAYGIIAQSIGGGGGLGGTHAGAFAGSTGTVEGARGGQVTINTQGDVSATGDGGVAIFAQSQGTADTSNGVPAASDIAITVGGTVTGGTGNDGAAILVGWGLDNTVQIDAGGQVTAGEGGNAIRFVADDASRTLVVTNDGTLTGDVVGGATIAAQSAAKSSPGIAAVGSRLAPSNLKIVNSTTGTLDAAQLYQADLINDGRLIVGTPLNFDLLGDHDMQELRIEGALAQSSSGQLVLVSDFATGQSDTLHVTGDVALDGTLEIQASTILRNASAQVLTTDGALTGGFSHVNSELFTYQLNQSDHGVEAIVREADLDQEAFNLTAQQSELAQHLEAIFYADELGFQTTFAALEATAREGTDSLVQSYRALSPQASLVGAAMNFRQTGLRMDELLSCNDFGGRLGTPPSDRCFNLNFSGQKIDQSTKDGAIGYNGTISSINAGGSVILQSGAVLSGLVGYESSDFSADSSTGTTGGDAAHIEVGLTRAWGNFSLSGALAVSGGRFDTTRSIEMTGHSAKAIGSYNATSAAGRVRAAYTFPAQSGFLRALVDLDVIHANADGYTETGAGNLNLQVDSSSGTAFVVSPALEVERTLSFGSEKSLRTYGLFGASFSSLDNYSTQAQFADAQAGGTGFASDLAIAPMSGRLALGVQFLNDDGLSIGAEYSLNVADGFEDHRATVNLRWTF